MLPPLPVDASSEKPFKILSIDGGGIKGLYSARILAQFEKKFQSRIVDHFDMLCGTSTGGLIALGLSLGIPAEEICTFYCTQGKHIFKRQNPIVAFFKQIFIRSKHQNDALRKSLQNIFGNRTLQESQALLCIPAFSITNGKPYIFKFDHLEGNLSRDNQTPYVDVALATSAAPSYLPIVTIPSHGSRQFADGGVYANNPTLVGIAEALRYFVGTDKAFQKMMVMSISSLEPSPPGKRYITNHSRSFLSWILTQDLFNLFMEGQSQITNYIADVLAQHIAYPFDYVRIPSVHLPHEHTRIINMDNSSKEALDLISIHGHEQALIYEKDPLVAKFFELKKQYITRQNNG